MDGTRRMTQRPNGGGGAGGAAGGGISGGAAAPGADAGGAGAGGAGADPILARLRAVYDAIAAEPLPERLVDLLARLDAAERGQ